MKSPDVFHFQQKKMYFPDLSQSNLLHIIKDLFIPESFGITLAAFFFLMGKNCNITCCSECFPISQAAWLLQSKQPRP